MLRAELVKKGEDWSKKLMQLKHEFIAVYDLLVTADGRFMALDGTMHPLYTKSSLQVRADDLKEISAIAILPPIDLSTAAEKKIKQYAAALESKFNNSVGKACALIKKSYQKIPGSNDTYIFSESLDEVHRLARQGAGAVQSELCAFVPEEHRKFSSIVTSYCYQTRHEFLVDFAKKYFLGEDVVRSLNEAPEAPISDNLCKRARKKQQIAIKLRHELKHCQILEKFILMALCEVNHKVELFLDQYRAFLETDGRSPEELQRLCPMDAFLKEVSFDQLALTGPNLQLLNLAQLQTLFKSIRVIDEKIEKNPLMDRFREQLAVSKQIVPTAAFVKYNEDVTAASDRPRVLRLSAPPIERSDAGVLELSPCAGTHELVFNNFRM
ncbi:MAG: hypothetical protein V4490_02340 [Pseudomonadota bacterium]